MMYRSVLGQVLTSDLLALFASLVVGYAKLARQLRWSIHPSTGSGRTGLKFEVSLPAFMDVSHTPFKLAQSCQLPRY